MNKHQFPIAEASVMFSPPPYFDQLALVQQSASFVGGLFVGTFWLIFVLSLGVLLLTYIKARFDS